MEWKKKQVRGTREQVRWKLTSSSHRNSRRHQNSRRRNHQDKRRMPRRVQPLGAVLGFFVWTKTEDTCAINK